MAEREEEIKSLLMRMNEESKKVGLKLNIQKTKVMASDPITFCHKGGVICISEVIDISPSNLDSSLCFIQPGISHDVLCIYHFTLCYRQMGNVSQSLPQSDGGDWLGPEHSHRACLWG